MKKQIYVLVIISSLSLFGCSPITPKEQARYEKIQYQQKNNASLKDKALMQCMLNYGAKNTSSDDFQQIETNLVARDVCRKKLENFEPLKEVNDVYISCSNGDDCHTKGVMVAIKHGKKFNHPTGLKYFEKGCSLNHAESCASVAIGFSDEKDETGKVNKFFKKACELNHATSCNTLGLRLNEKGKSKQARTFFDRSCSLQYGEGCHGLAYLLHEGKGGNKNINKAKYYFKKGCDFGYKNSCQNFNILNKN